jgi:glycosyltransferase involved in cell wall biosynthesis
MEYAFYRQLDLRTAGPADYWLASSRCTQRLYLRAGVPAHRVFLGYYGIHPQSCIRPRTGAFRSSIGIESNRLIVGNINLMYPPKRYLGQFIGLKCHETVIDALGIVCGRRPDVTGVLVGGEWGGGHRYEDSLRLRAMRVGKGRILLPGRLSPAGVATAWPDFDCAIHFPLSENTGGVHEALLNGVPTIAGRVGALPEIVIDGMTGKLIDDRSPACVAEAILEVLDDLPRYRRLAATGCKLVSTMCNVSRTAPDVALLYRHILNPAFPPPAEFDPVAFVEQLTMEPLASSVPGTVQ